MATTMPAQNLRIAQGEDATIVIPVVNAAGAAVPVDTADQIIVTLLVNNTVGKKFTKTSPPTGYGTLTVGTGGDTHKITLPLVRADSDGFGTGILKAEVLVRSSTDVHTVYYTTLGAVAEAATKEEATS
jgi:hypothetical protein